MKLRVKTIAIAISLTLLSLIISNFLSVNYFSQQSTGIIKERAANNAKYFSSVIDSWLTNNVAVINSASYYCSTITTSENEAQLYEYLNMLTNSSDIISDVYVGVDTGFLYDGSGWIPEPGWSCLTRGWYKEALKIDGVYYGVPYLDDNTGDIAISVSKKCTFKDGQVAVISMDLNATKLMSGVDGLVKGQLSNESYVFVEASDGSVIYHPNKEFKSTAGKTKYVKDINEGKYKSSGSNYFKDYDGKEKFLLSTKSEKSGWTVYLVEPSSVIEDIIQSIWTRNITTLVLSLIISVVVLVFALTKLLNPLSVGTAALNNLADLNVMRPDESIEEYKKSSDETGEIARAIGELQKSFSQVVMKVKNVSSDISQTSVSIDNIADETMKGTAQISSMVDHLTKSSQKMADSVQSANIQILEMGTVLDEIKDSVGKMVSLTDDTMSANKSAMEHMTKLNEVSKRSNSAVIEITNKIQECSNATDGIRVATDVITNISEQTNLLSLNASIEAARAGDAGRGFAVVAGEIRKLAEQSSMSANNIQNIISDMIGKVDACVSQADTLQKIIETQMNLLGVTEEKIKVANTSTENVSTASGSIDAAAKSILELKDGIMNNISNLASISEKNAASAEESAASINDISSTISSAKTESSRLADYVENLSEQMRKFK